MSCFSKSKKVIRAESHIAKLLRNVYGGGTGLNLATLDARDNRLVVIFCFAKKTLNVCSNLYFAAIFS